ncbi:hypothetical protein CASFOL_036823 [Castilleja foliolosa]|uniref:Uncharacterized protein n=1 Tax=Castilleja foliolosa TaxID=1961234 RepID=A0ABD3BP53_9LAMI
MASSLGTKGNKVPILTNHFKVNMSNVDDFFFPYNVVEGQSNYPRYNVSNKWDCFEQMGDVMLLKWLIHLEKEQNKEVVDCSTCGSSGYAISGDLDFLQKLVMEIIACCFRG